MTLKPGTQLGSYEVLSLIGKGGMGEVYRAHDTKLKREVALKVLPEAFARDPERLARFRREAQLLASLNHPNIAAIYGLEESDGHSSLVLEYVPGETLAERITNSGSLPIEEALEITKQACEALEHAHEKGIIHRDLKPANIKLTAEGKVKVLDFGLAKAFASDPAGNLLDSNSPTVPPGASPTMPGVILGTAAYMSPEQARGKTVDKRTDIFALGCVLYELLTGKRTFEGETVTDVLGAVLHKEPDWSLLPANTPPGIRALLRRCLQKDSSKRLRSAADISIAIEDTASASVAQPPPASVVSRKMGWRLTAFLSLSSLGIATIAGMAVWILRAPAPQPVTRMAINLPTGQRLAGLDHPALAISRDGKNIVYVAIQAGPQQLFLRPLDSGEAKPIVGTDGAVAPFFSPDGQWVGFFAGGTLKKVSVNGAAAVTLARADTPGGVSWGDQGILAWQPTGTAGGLQQVSQEGGASQPLTALAKGEFTHRWPEFLPGGRAILFAASPSIVAWNNAEIAAQFIGGGQRKNLVHGGSQPRYTPTGHLLFAQGGTLMAAPFDARRLALTGAAVPAIESVMQSTATGAAQYDISSTGSLIYLTGGIFGSQMRLVWVSRNGQEQPLPAPAHNYAFPRLSADGRLVAVGIAEQETQIWTYDPARDTLTRLTFEGDNNNTPAWTPDGKRIAFRSNRAGAVNLFWQAADGSGGAERLTTSEYLDIPNSFSPDGQHLAFIEVNPATGRDIWVLNLKDRKAQPFLKTPYEESSPKFSPDGRWLVYSSNESGRNEIHVQPYPGPGGKWQISTEGGTEPAWNPSGRELFYRSGNRMMAVEVDTRSGFSASKPRMLFEGPYATTTTSFPYYDVSPDGQRFLMLKPVESQTSAPTQINVVLSWFEELKKKVPVK